MSGNYTFTLTTYPGEDIYEESAADYSEDNKEAFNINMYDTIDWTYNGENESDGAENRSIITLKVLKSQTGKMYIQMRQSLWKEMGFTA